jgi:hypothetical protein
MSNLSGIWFVRLGHFGCRRRRNVHEYGLFQRRRRYELSTCTSAFMLAASRCAFGANLKINAIWRGLVGIRAQVEDVFPNLLQLRVEPPADNLARP